MSSNVILRYLGPYDYVRTEYGTVLKGGTINITNKGDAKQLLASKKYQFELVYESRIMQVDVEPASMIPKKRKIPKQ